MSRVPSIPRRPADPLDEIEAMLNASEAEQRSALARLIAEELAQIENEMDRKARGRPRKLPGREP